MKYMTLRALSSILLLTLSCHSSQAFGSRNYFGPKTYFVPDIRLNGVIDSDSVEATIKLINEAQAAKADVIILEINSPGGEVYSGFELSKTIESSPIPIVCVVDQEAASMAGYILQSCQVRMMTKRSTIMTHEPAVGGMFSGQPTTWQNIAEMLKALTRGMCQHISHRTRITPEALEAKIAGGHMWWMNWNEAWQWGFVDYVVDSVQDVQTSYHLHKVPPENLAKGLPQQAI